jgi:hypothetical protein
MATLACTISSAAGMGAEEALARHKDKVKRRWVSSNDKTDLII